MFPPRCCFREFSSRLHTLLLLMDSISVILAVTHLSPTFRISWSQYNTAKSVQQS